MENVESTDVKPKLSPNLAGVLESMNGLRGASEFKADFLKSAGVDPEGVKKPEIKPAAPAKTETTPTKNVGDEPAEGEPAKGVAAEKPKGDDAPAAEEELLVDSNILGKIGGKKGAKAAEVKLENFDQAKDLIKKEFGQDLKDIADLPKFLNNAKQWKSEASRITEVQAKADQYEKVFTELPDSIVDQIAAFHKGEDYLKVKEAAPRIDYNRKPASFEAKELVDHYFPGEFTAEDFEGEKGKDLKIAEKAAKDKFLSEQSTYNKTRDDNYKAQKALVEARKQSVTVSMSKLKESFPNVADSVLSEVQAAMSSGEANGSLFMEKDGKFKPDAAERIMLAKHGKETIAQLTKLAEHKAETATNEEILTRGADRPRPGKGGSGGEANTKVKEYMNNVGVPLRKSTY